MNVLQEAFATMRPRDLVRYCPECGTIGPVPRVCCPDGHGAPMVPGEVARQAKIGFLTEQAQS